MDTDDWVLKVINRKCFFGQTTLPQSPNVSHIYGWNKLTKTIEHTNGKLFYHK